MSIETEIKKKKLENKSYFHRYVVEKPKLLLLYITCLYSYIYL